MHRLLWSLVLLLISAKGFSIEHTAFPSSWLDATKNLPVLAEGRVMPLDTWARVAYSRITGRDNDPNSLEWTLRLMVFPEQVLDDSIFLVNDPSLLIGLGVTLGDRHRASFRELLPVLHVAPQWVESFSTDSTPQARESLRLARALLFAQGIAATFDFSSPDSLSSPLLNPGSLNPAQALANKGLASQDRDRLGLLVLWFERSRAGSWNEAAEAMSRLAGNSSWLEVAYNQVPWAAIILGASWGALLLSLGAGKRRRRVAKSVAWSSLVIISCWIGARVLISGRPPVTNLAGTFLVVGWLLIGIAVIAQRREAGRVLASLCLGSGGIMPLLFLAFQGSGDTFGPLQAVLNTNFWLGIHVLMIVAGYATTFLAGLIGHAYLWISGNRKSSRHLEKLWNYLSWSLAIAITLVATGTLLGGVWADQSWGRFWGWDPKENGALMIILWLAMVLHLKPAGLTAEWGVAWGAAALVPVLLFSWMGVNLIGQGFHSYGAAPGKALVFWGLLAADVLTISLMTVRKVLR